MGCRPRGVRWAPLTPPPLGSPDTIDRASLPGTLPLCNGHTLRFGLRKHVFDPLTCKAKQAFFEGCWLNGSNSQTGMSLLPTHGHSSPEGQRAGERMALHVNEPALVKRPLRCHLLENGDTFPVADDSLSFTGSWFSRLCQKHLNSVIEIQIGQLEEYSSYWLCPSLLLF